MLYLTTALVLMLALVLVQILVLVQGTSSRGSSSSSSGSTSIVRSDFNRRPDSKGGTYRKPATPLPPLPLAPHGPSHLVLGLERRWKLYS